MGDYYFCSDAHIIYCVNRFFLDLDRLVVWGCLERLKMMNLFKKRNQDPTDSDGILGKGILHLDAIISELTENQAKQENKPKEPHVRIEFDHINDVPTIFIDGEKVQDGLVSLNVDWKTNTENHVKKTFEVKMINKDGYGTTIGENSLI